MTTRFIQTGAHSSKIKTSDQKIFNLKKFRHWTQMVKIKHAKVQNVKKKLTHTHTHTCTVTYHFSTGKSKGSVISSLGEIWLEAYTPKCSSLPTIKCLSYRESKCMWERESEEGREGGRKRGWIECNHLTSISLNKLVARKKILKVLKHSDHCLTLAENCVPNRL